MANVCRYPLIPRTASHHHHHHHRRRHALVSYRVATANSQTHTHTSEYRCMRLTNSTFFSHDHNVTAQHIARHFSPMIRPATRTPNRLCLLVSIPRDFRALPFPHKSQSINSHFLLPHLLSFFVKYQIDKLVRRLSVYAVYLWRESRRHRWWCLVAAVEASCSCQQLL